MRDHLLTRGLQILSLQRNGIKRLLPFWANDRVVRAIILTSFIVERGLVVLCDFSTHVLFDLATGVRILRVRSDTDVACPDRCLGITLISVVFGCAVCHWHG